MAISESSRSNLNWLFLEGVLIVVSILLAFWIDAWWDDRGDRAEEREILIGLELEFVDLVDRLDRWTAVNRRRAHLIERYLTGSVSEMDPESIEATLYTASIANVLDKRGALDALLASGRLERISNREVRARLAKWPSWLDDIRTNDLFTRDFTIGQIQPFLAKHGFPRKICPDGRYYCSGSEPPDPVYVQLAENPEFRALLILRRGWALGAVKDHGNAELQAEETLTMIRAELAVLDSK